MKDRKKEGFSEKQTKRLEKRALAHRIPLRLHIDLTWLCPWNCRHCYLQNSRRTTDELSTKDWARVLHEAAELGTLYLTLSGGDPMMRRDFGEILEIARSLRYAVTLKTTGWLIDGFWAKRFAELGQVRVHISIHGATAVTHDHFVRCEGAFVRANKSIELLVAASVPVKITTCAVVENVDELASLKSRCEELGVQNNVSTFLFSKREGNRVCGELDERTQAELLASRLIGFKPKPPRRDDVLCKAGISAWCITPYGEVNPCVSWPMPVGDIRQGLRTIIESNEARRIARLRQRDRLECWSCELIKWCIACPGESWLETRDPLRPSSLACRRARVYRMASVLANESR